MADRAVLIGYMLIKCRQYDQSLRWTPRSHRDREELNNRWKRMLEKEMTEFKMFWTDKEKKVSGQTPLPPGQVPPGQV